MNPTKAKKLTRWNSTIPVGERKQQRARAPIAKVGKQKAKRVAKNREYYSSSEWRAKKKAVHERDGYRCTEMVPTFVDNFGRPDPRFLSRCPNRGEVVNGKQTARGLVCEERSYGHRGVPDCIDTCTTRCKHCDRAKTPLERINHRYGFNRAGR